MPLSVDCSSQQPAGLDGEHTARLGAYRGRGCVMLFSPKLYFSYLVIFTPTHPPIDPSSTAYLATAGHVQAARAHPAAPQCPRPSPRGVRGAGEEGRMVVSFVERLSVEIISIFSLTPISLTLPYHPTLITPPRPWSGHWCSHLATRASGFSTPRPSPRK